MRLHRFIGNFDLSGKEIKISDLEIANQIRKVLRLRTGDKIILSDGKMAEALAEIAESGENYINLKIAEKYENRNEPKRRVSLFCAILKRENFELVVQKGVETGVFEIIPLITERTVKTGLNMARLRKIAKEAAEQSGRGMIPAIHEPIDFESAINDAKNLNILFHLGEKLFFEMPCAARRREQSNSPAGEYACISEDNFEPLNIFIGPEGGFTEDEVRIAEERDFAIASLGPLTLRAETAAIIASYLAANQK